MRRTWIMLLVAAILAARASAAETPALKTQTDKVSYGFGVELAKNFKQQGIEVNVDSLAKGLKDAMAGQKLLMTDEELSAIMSAFRSELVQKRTQTGQKATDENKKVGEAFLAENKKKEGVVTLPSGLQYRVIKAGNGKTPTATDTVECHYRGTLIDGTEFDSSYSRGQPAVFRVSKVIAGWKEALQLMPVGSKWQLFVPSQLAYKERGAGGKIGPNATLIFEVELLGIK
jgi:UDP-GlcNAc:undecaprenyl-phosphate/decaprenyl-phosphate GlcNAc-1-phosphate transferase